MSLVEYGLAAAAFAALGVYVFRERLGLGGGRKKTVMLLRPNDRHYTDVKVTETDLSLESPKTKGVTRFFIKKYPGWTADKTGDSRYFGLEAWDLTLNVREEVTHTLSLLEAVKTVLHEVDFDKFTPAALKEMNAAKFGITTEAITREGTAGTNQGNENVFTESDKALIKAKGEAAAKAAKGGKNEWTPVLLGFFFGALLMYIAVNQHWLKVA